MSNRGCMALGSGFTLLTLGIILAMKLVYQPPEHLDEQVGAALTILIIGLIGLGITTIGWALYAPSRDDN